MLILLSVLFAYINLESHAIYYSKNISHSKNKNPELVMIVEHLDRIKLPTSKSNYKVNLDGNPALIFCNNYLIERLNKHIELSDKKLFSNKGYIYYYSNNGKYLKAMSNEKWKTDLSNTRKNESEKVLKKIIEPIVEVQDKPIVNLQWLFNMFYEKRFK